MSIIFERGYFDDNIVSETSLNDSLNESRSFDSRYASKVKPTVFLSHKHDDLSEVKGVFGMLQKHGAKIYIDSMDNRMPNQTSGETALRIKEMIKFCDKFILLATNNAIESYWCNWELGIGDTHKYSRHIAILPIKEKNAYDSTYKGNEYLQIYPTIDFEYGGNNYKDGRLIPKGFYISNSNNKDGIRYITPLKDWIESRY